MIKAMTEGADASPIIGQFAADPEARISAEMLEATEAKAKVKLVQDLTQGEVAALTTFMESIGLEKAKRLGVAVQRLRLEIANETDPEMDARVEKLAEAAVNRYIAEKDAEAGSADD